jgi:hypothetical protein
LIPNENSIFDEKAWEKKTKGPKLDKKPIGKKLASGNFLIDVVFLKLTWNPN